MQEQVCSSLLLLSAPELLAALRRVVLVSRPLPASKKRGTFR